MTGWPLYALVMLATGIGIPIMAALNAGLGARIGSAPAASCILFTVALMIAMLATWLTGLPRASSWAEASPVYYAGGSFVAFYVLAVTWIAPRFGVANAVFFVLLGQLVSAAAIDHFGLFGAPRAPLSLMRTAGLTLMAIGVFLARQPFR